MTNEVFRHKLDHFSADQLEIVEEMLNYMQAKCIGIPIKLAKKRLNSKLKGTLLPGGVCNLLSRNQVK